MMFIVTLIALLIERFFDWSHLRNWQWYNNYQRYISQKLSGQSAYVVLAATIVPILFGVAILALLFKGMLFGVISLLFELFILIYCFGPANLWAEAYACINALTQGDLQHAANYLKTSFGVTEIATAQEAHKNLMISIFIQANRRVFACVFWFAVLGPVGPLLYRMVATSAQYHGDDMPVNTTHAANTVESILDWLPIRLFTFIFALGGEYVRVFACWRKKVLLGLAGNEDLLVDCGEAALGLDENAKVPEDGSAEQNAVSLIDRSLIIVLVVIAVVALVL